MKIVQIKFSISIFLSYTINTHQHPMIQFTQSHILSYKPTKRETNIQIDSNCLENQIMIFMSKKLGILSTIYTRKSKLAHV